MKNKAVVVLVTEVSFAAEILQGDFVNEGIIFRLSDKSDIKMWVPKTEIKNVILPDTKVIEGAKLDSLFQELDRVCREYGFEEEV